MHDRAHEILKRFWGYDEFRPLQEEIIREVLSGHDTLGLMPTGGGKSITFQVPTMMMDGLALVVTPIISLMKDQVDNLISRRIKATYLHSGLTMAEVRRAYEKCINGGCKFLYVSPERLGSESFREHLRQMKVSLIVVDEAHCISQWGYDFRPSFLKISQIRTLLKGVPLLALTATAPPLVVDDIMRQLHFSSPNVLKMSFRRENLSYVVRKTSDKLRELKHILNSVPGSAVIYVRSRKRTKQISDELKACGIGADYYHAGLSREEKEDKQNKWKNDELRVIVATNAFGMGIDKADVRVVAHVDVPNSLEEYYQEAGRAGRDGKRAYAILLVTDVDRRVLHRHLTEAFPEKDFIKTVYERVGDFLGVALGCGYDQVFDFNFNLFCATYNLPVLATYNSLKILTQAKYIEYIEEMETQSRVKILADKDELYDIPTQVKDVDVVLQALLRSYTGLFADYVFINEDVLAYRYNLSQETIYTALLELTRLHILHYVPRKRTPMVIYTTSREEKKHVLISREVYEEMRDRMSQRIERVIDYAYGDNCRELTLLDYFGEQAEATCGVCDVCINVKKQGSYSRRDVRDGICYMAQIKPRQIGEFLEILSFRKEDIIAELSALVDEGVIIHLDDDTYKNPRPLR